MEQAGCTQVLKLSAVQAVLSEQALEQVQAVKLAEQEQKQAGLQVQSLKCPRVVVNTGADWMSSAGVGAGAGCGSGIGCGSGAGCTAAGSG